MTELLDAVTRTHRPVRTLPPGEGPFDGVLVAVDGRVAVAVPAVALAGEPLWRWAGAEHVAAPLDLALGEEGTDVLLPWCTETATAFLARRELAGDALAPGEAGTLAVSVLRGLAELGDDPTGVGGRWWLTDDARPVLVVAPGSDAAAASAELLALLGRQITDRTLARVLTELVAALDRPRTVLREILRWEGEILACAAPRPLRADVHPPTRAAAAPVSAPVRFRSLESAPAAGWREGLAERIDAARVRMRRLVERMRRQPSTTPAASAEKPRAGRRRPLLVGGAVAAAILGGGLLWPAAADETAGETAGPDAVTIEMSDAAGGADTDAAGRTAPGDGRATAPDTHERGMTAPDTGEAGAEDPIAEGPGGGSSDAIASDPADASPVGAVPRLLSAAAACAATAPDAACPAAVAGGQSVSLTLLAAHAAAATGPELVEDYGDIAVVRLPASDRVQEVIVVLARTNENWLFRDLYEVAEQPE